MVGRIYPYDNPSSGCFRKRSIYAAGGGDRSGRRCGRFNDRGRGIRSGRIGGRGRGEHGQGVCGGGSGTHEN